MSVAEHTSPSIELPYEYTVDQYHDMIRLGILEEGAPYELLDGQVVRKVRSQAGADPMTIYPPHARAVKGFAAAGSLLSGSGCHIQTQQPITIPPKHEPEPDGAIVRGRLDDYLDRHPGPADILLVMEVSDATLTYDRNRKLSVYADAGLPAYAIVNLIDQVVEFYTLPIIGEGRYDKCERLPQDGQLVLPVAVGSPVSIPVRSLMP